MVHESLLGLASDWIYLAVDPAVNGYLFRIKRVQTNKKGEGWTPLVICCAQDTVGI